MNYLRAPITKKYKIKIEQLFLLILIGLIHAETFKWAINKDIIVGDDIMFTNTPLTPH